MAIDLVTTQKEADLLQIRHGLSPEDAAAEALKKHQADEAEFTRIKQVDDLRLKVNSGAQLTTDEEKLLKELESGAAPAPAEVKTPEQVQQEELAKQIDAITDKLSKGEELSDEEKALSNRLMDSPVVIDKSYKVGGKELKASELAPKLAAEWGVPIEEIPANVLAKAIDNYVVKLNKEEWSKAQTVRDQQLASGRRQVGEVMVNLMNASQTLRLDLERTQKALVKAKALADKEFDLNSIYTSDGRVDPIKQYELNKILNAREQLPGLQEELQEITERSAQTERDLTAQQFRDFQAAHPEYMTSQDVVQVSRLIGTDSISAEDELKISEMVRIFREANANRITPDKEHRYRLEVGTLKIKPAPVSQEPDALRFDKSQKPEAEKLLAALKKKREALSIGSPGAANRERVPDEKKAAQSIRAGSMAATGTSLNKTEGLAKLGY